MSLSARRSLTRTCLTSVVSKSVNKMSGRSTYV